MSKSREMGEQDQAKWRALEPDFEQFTAAQVSLASDVANGRAALEHLAQSGSVLAKLALAKSFVTTAPTNFLRAEELFREAYDRGALDAFPALARCLLRRGELAAGEKVLAEGVALGDALSMEWLAHFRLAQSPANLTEAATLLRESASQGKVRSSMRLAHLQMRVKLGMHLIPLGIVRAIYTTVAAFRIASRDFDDRLLQ
jgi:hypothetical protein